MLYNPYCCTLLGDFSFVSSSEFSPLYHLLLIRQRLFLAQWPISHATVACPAVLLLLVLVMLVGKECSRDT